MTQEQAWAQILEKYPKAELAGTRHILDRKTKVLFTFLRVRAGDLRPRFVFTASMETVRELGRNEKRVMGRGLRPFRRRKSAKSHKNPG